MIRRTVLVLTAGISALAAQSPPAPAAAEPKGVAAVWDVRNQLTALAGAVRELEPLLGRVDGKIMAENGAPDAYVQQVRSVQNAIKSLLVVSDQLAREPEKLPVALDVYFQMERMDLLLGSLRDGIRKYQSPDLADMITQAMAKNVVHRDRLRQHISDVAELHDQEYQIANEEAQRCRGTLTKQPVTAPKPPASKTAAPPPADGSSSNSQQPASRRRK